MYEVDIMVRRGTDEPKRPFPTIQGERMRTEVIQEFLVFARHLNFSKAAAELHITQPNLSKHMMELEREIGVELIDRKTYGKNRPVLSEAGKYFFEEMSYIETSIQGTVKRCRALGSSGIRDVRVQEIWQNNAMFKLYSLAASQWLGEDALAGVAYLFVRGGEFRDARSGVYARAADEAFMDDCRTAVLAALPHSTMAD